MARHPRFDLPGQPQHVIQSGNNRSVIFGAEEDYRFYLEKLQAACQKYTCDLHAYVLMTNHVHLLMTPQQTGALGKVMQTLGRYYVQYFNNQYERTGTLWEGRYKATLLDSDQYLLICSRYIELNPVRAAMVDHPSEYPWSSYGFNAFGQENKLLTPHPLYLALGGGAEQRQIGYRALFTHHVPERMLNEIREATNKAWVLGSDRFNEEIERLLQRQARPKPRGGDRRSGNVRKDTINRL